MITEEELEKLFGDIEETFESSEEDLMGIVIFVSLETKGHVYGIGSGKTRLIEDMKIMIKELESNVSGRLN